jgi:hypothetical protein
MALLLIIITATIFNIILLMSGQEQGGVKEESFDKDAGKVKEDKNPKSPFPPRPGGGTGRPRPGQKKPPPNPPSGRPKRPDKVPGLQ